MAKSKPDGYTLLLTTPAIAAAPVLYPSSRVDPSKDFVPVSNIAQTVPILVVNPSVGVNSDVDFRADFALRDALSADFRRNARGRLDVRYGAGARQLLDVFPADRPDASSAPIHVHVHGGFFRMGHKSSVSCMAQPFVAAGVSCVMPTYDLAPAVSVETIVAQVLDAVEWVYRNGASFGNPDGIFVSGSSAGAHLCAMALNHDWTSRGLPPDVIKGAMLLTGICNLEPVLRTSLNPVIGLTPERVRALSPMHNPPIRPVPVLLQVGALEPPGWQAQSSEFENVCRRAGCGTELLVLPGETHFSIGPRIARHPDHPLAGRMIAMMNGAAGGPGRTAHA